MKMNTNRLIKTFSDMVRIDSESGYELPFAEYMQDLASRHHKKSWTDAYHNVYIEIPGKGTPIMFNTHMDTVSPGKNIKPRKKGEYITSDGTTILGADSKAGIAAMVEMFTILDEEKIPHRPILLTLTCNEESGIPTAQHIISDVKTCIVPDRGTPVGEIITEAPYAQVYEVNIKGKSVYAPTSYAHGKSAIMAAIEMINRLPIGDVDQETTTNIGIMNGGLMTSMVPESCMFKGNCYSFNKKSFDSFLLALEHIVACVDGLLGTKSTVTMLEYFGGYAISKSDPLVKLVDRAMKKTGITPAYNVYKAVTNANLLNDAGIKSILISTGVENQHTVKERISINALKQITEVLLHVATD